MIINNKETDLIEKTVDVLKKGGVIIYPTDTLYGLGVDIENDEAVKKLENIKGRPGPWSIAVSDMKMLSSYAKTPKHHFQFINNKLPGSNTIILESKSNKISKYLLGPNNSIGIRIPDHLIPKKITKLLGKGITSTSVNRTKSKPLNDSNLIINDFFNNVDLILDFGKLPNSKASNIYNLTGNKIIKIR